MIYDKSEFHDMTLGPSVRVHVDSTPTFKRTTVAAFLQHPLAPESVAAIGLLPRIIRRGNTEWPTAMALERELDGLYGTRLGTGVQKAGDRHLTWFVLNLPADRYIAQPVFAKGMHILKTTMFSPVVEHGGLQRDIVEQEKQLQVGRIRALINNKSSYAVHRCVQGMYQNDPFRLFELGTEEDVRRLTPEGLLETHSHLIGRAPIDIYVVGDVQPDQVYEALQNWVPETRDPQPLVKTLVEKGSGAPQTIIEEEVMGQGWLVLGFRTDVAYADPDRYAMQFLNGVLGGFVHSKLFLNVREKASLAYQASSGYNANKGYLVALAGIDPAKYEQALEIMLKQVDDIQKGDISKEEMEATRSRLLARTRLAQDDAMARMMRHFSGSTEGVQERIDDVLARLNAISKDDVVAAAQRVRLDTIYFLKGVARKETVGQ